MSNMYKIFVGNISFETTEDQLRKVFEPHMEIEDLVIAREEETGKSKGYGFVMTRDPIRGRRAVTQVGKFFIDGRLAYAKEAHNGKPSAKGRGGAGRGNRRRVSHRPRPMRRSVSRSAGANGSAAGGGGYTGGGEARQPVSRGYVGLDGSTAPASPPPGNAADSDSR